MQAIIDFLHKARAYAEQNNMGNEEGVLARAIHGLTSVMHMDADFINRWDPQTGEVADVNEEAQNKGEITLGRTGPLPGVSKDNLFNPIKLSTHSPTFVDQPDPARGQIAHERVGDADVALKQEDGVGTDPAKANPVEAGAESNYHVAPLAPPAPAKGVTSTNQNNIPVGAGPDAPRSAFMTGTQGTQPGPKSPFAPAQPSRSVAADRGVDLPVPVEETSHGPVEGTAK